MKTNKPLIVTNEILLNASIEKVWDMLVNPEQTKRYMFGCEAISEWKPGSSLIWRMNHEGKEIVAVKGEVVSITPDKHLAYTVFDPNTNMADVPENYLTVTYGLQEEKGNTRFIVTQGDFSAVADGDRRYTEAYNNGEGWNPILIEIKKLVEINHE